MPLKISIVRTATAALSAAVLLSGLTACGGDDPPKADAKAKAYLEEVRKSLADRKSAELTGTQRVGQGDTMKLDGKVSWAQGTVGELAVSGEDGGGRTAGKVTPQALYLDMGAAGLAGKPWLKTTAEETRGATGQLLADALRHGDPAALLAALAGAEDLKEREEKPFNGLPARHFTGSVEGGRADVWIGLDGLPLHTETRIKGADGTVEFKGDYKNFGVPVDVTVPPADQVYDLAEMAGGTGTFPSGFPTSIAPPPAD